MQVHWTLWVKRTKSVFRVGFAAVIRHGPMPHHTWDIIVDILDNSKSI